MTELPFLITARLFLLFSLVVWKLGDPAVVERLVAERGLCVIRGVPRGGLRRALVECGESTQASGAAFVRCSGRHRRFLCARLQKDHIVLYEMQRAFAVDALASSHPLSRAEEEVNTPAEITEMFNTISYNKVSS